MQSGWFDRLLGTIAERGRAWIRIPANLAPADQLREMADSLVSERGEAAGAALAGEVLARLEALPDQELSPFYAYLAREFAPDPVRLTAAAEQYLADPSPDRASALSEAAESPRLELLRRLNMAPGGTAALVRMRERVLALLRTDTSLQPLERDLKHLLVSWFNRGFLDLQRIDWNSPASVLERVMAYEAVHEVRGWDDLRRRLAPDRRCFAFFHPALADDPLIFVEVALTQGLASAIEPLLTLEQPPVPHPDTAIFYSISNCHPGLRGVSFGHFLIKQVVEELKSDVPSLVRFATLSPIPGFRKWLEREMPDHPAFRDAALAGSLKQLCARYLADNPTDPVARFHLRNGARLERVHLGANPSPRGISESFGMMVNYLYDLDRIEANHEAFVREGTVAKSPEIDTLLREAVAEYALQGR
jgi:malonyl-CoA decarboxylase